MDETVIVGASAAGLATAASLRERGRSFRLLEKAPHVGASWRAHYDRLHLHTSKGFSGLPGLPMPRGYPRYPSREQMVAYLEGYARHFDLRPEFSVSVDRIARKNGGWEIATSAEGGAGFAGDGRSANARGTGRLEARNVVVATGNTRVPHQPSWPDQAAFQGSIFHSSQYRTGAAWRGRRVLVIGFGNSGGEIAIDLHENGALPDLAVRGAVNVIPRDLLGLPVLAVGIAMDAFPPRVADALSAPLLRLTVGDIRGLGFRKLPYGPAVQINRHGRIPLLDIGTLALVRSGAVKIRPGVERFTPGGVVFDGGAEAAYDAVVLATGFRPKVSEILEGDVLDADGTPRTSGREAAPGLYFCGFFVSPTGMLRAIGRESAAIARAIARAPEATPRSASPAARTDSR
jgi:cation diffusion facilitator CzcD-associated flavoprotein CzcO